MKPRGKGIQLLCTASKHMIYYNNEDSHLLVLLIFCAFVLKDVSRLYIPYRCQVSVQSVLAFNASLFVLRECNVTPKLISRLGLWRPSV